LRVSSWRGRAKHMGIWSILRHGLSRVESAFFSSTEIMFLEYAAPTAVNPSDIRLQPLSLKLLAGAAMQYENEQDTLNYISRCVKRLRSSGTEGFALATTEGIPLHFCWVAPFDGFHMAELNQPLSEPGSNAVLLCDGYTPLSERGQGHEGLCASQVGLRMLETGKRLWTFSTFTNTGLSRDLPGFVARFSIRHKRRMMVDQLSTFEFKTPEERVLNLYPAA
jgi:hypothetical protein